MLSFISEKKTTHKYIIWFLTKLRLFDQIFENIKINVYITIINI